MLDFEINDFHGQIYCLFYYIFFNLYLKQSPTKVDRSLEHRVIVNSTMLPLAAHASLGLHAVLNQDGRAQSLLLLKNPVCFIIYPISGGFAKRWIHTFPKGILELANVMKWTGIRNRLSAFSF